MAWRWGDKLSSSFFISLRSRFSFCCAGPSDLYPDVGSKELVADVGNGAVWKAIICAWGPQGIAVVFDVIAPDGAVGIDGIIIGGFIAFPAPLSIIGGGKGGGIICWGYWGIPAGYGMKGGKGVCAGA